MKKRVWNWKAGRRFWGAASKTGGNRWSLQENISLCRLYYSRSPIHCFTHLSKDCMALTLIQFHAYPILRPWKEWMISPPLPICILQINFSWILLRLSRHSCRSSSREEDLLSGGLIFRRESLPTFVFWSDIVWQPSNHGDRRGSSLPRGDGEFKEQTPMI